MLQNKGINYTKSLYYLTIVYAPLLLYFLRVNPPFKVVT